MSTTIPAKLVKELREKTGAGMMDCKKALEEAGGDLEAAVAALRTKGLADAAKRAGRAANEGLVDSYIHAGGRVGVLLEVNCETDFVARTDEFKSFVHDVALHIAALKPRFVSADEVPEEYIASEKAIYEGQAGRPRARARARRRGEARQAARDHLPARPGVRARPGREEAAHHRGAAGRGLGAASARTSRSGASACSSLASSTDGQRSRRPGDGPGGAAFKRVVLKLSGEALMGDEPYGIDPMRIAAIARQVKEAHERGVDVAIVVGAGNIFRGLQGMAHRHGPRDGGLHGHDRDDAERPGDPGRAREARPDDPRAVGDRHAGGGRAVHPAARHPPPREAAAS